MRVLLEDAGLTVSGLAGTWEEAIEMAAAAPPEAIVLDLWMPTFDRALVLRLRAAAPNSLLFVVSGLAAAEAERAVDGIDGVAGVRSKRESPQSAVMMVRDALLTPPRYA